MALIDRYKERYANQLAVETSNPRDETASTTDDTRIQLACDDVEGLLEIYAGVVYDETDARIVAIAVEGVANRLLVVTGQARASDKWAKWVESAEALGRVSGRNRILADTPTPDLVDEFASENFTEFIARSPAGTDDDEED